MFFFGSKCDSLLEGKIQELEAQGRKCIVSQKKNKEFSSSRITYDYNSPF